LKLSFLGPHNGERVRYLFRQNADYQPLAMILIILFPRGRPHREVPLERVTGLESKIMSTEPIRTLAEPTMNDLLLPFEKQNFPAEYGQTSLNVAYTGVEEKTWALGLFDLLLHDFMMEEMLFKDYFTRLQFDEKLLTMRARFEVYKEQLRRDIATRYNLTPPAGPTIVP
jgi:hypothetical protein